LSRGLLLLQAALVGATLALFACVETVDSDPLQQVPDLPEEDSMLARSLPMDVTPVAASAVPEIIYAEDVPVHIERVVHMLDEYESSFREDLYSDGTGRVQLGVKEYMSTRTGGWGEVPAESMMMYEDRDHFLVYFRDLHLGHPTAYAANYQWFVDAKPHQVADRTCTMWSARSTHGFGGADLMVDNETGVLLGWTVFGPDLDPQIECTPTAVDYAPDLSGVNWHTNTAHSEGFNLERDGAELGFTPRMPLYVPEGFYLDREAIASAGIEEVPTKAYVALYHDGLRTLFIVEAAAPKGTDERDQLIIDKVRRSRFGGIELVEGVSGDLEIYVLSGLPADELHTVFGSLIE
jgi:hypothetical protein